MRGLSGAVVRMRANSGPLALLGLLTLFAAVLLSGAPRIANQLADEALRTYVAGLPYQVRDLSYTDVDGRAPLDAEGFLARQRAELNPGLADRVGPSWYTVTAPWQNMVAVQSDLPVVQGFGGPLYPKLGVRTGNGFEAASRMVAGRWPQNAARPPRLEVVLTEISARLMDQQVGSDLTLQPVQGAGQPVLARVVGIIAPLDETDPIWDLERRVLQADMPEVDGEVVEAEYLTDVDGAAMLAEAGISLAYQFRYRVDESAVDMAQVPDLVAALVNARGQGLTGQGETGLDGALGRFADQARTAQALLAVVQAGALATLGGLVLLAARLAVARRRDEFQLLRARGATLVAVARRTLAEVAPAVLVAGSAGWILGSYALGRPDNTLPVLAAFVLVALLALPALAMRSLRRLNFGGERDEVGTERPGMRRLTAELSLLAAAGAGLWLLRSRGLSADSTVGVDPYLVTVPVLLAAAAAIVSLRLIPAPLRWGSRITARARGTVSFLGLARAARAAPASVGPIAVLVMAVCTAVFSMAVAGTVAEARDRATDQDVVADAVLRAEKLFTPETSAELTALPGITHAAQFLIEPSVALSERSGTGLVSIGSALVLVVDGPEFAAAARQAGNDAQLPPEIISARPGVGGQVPAVLSPAVARDLGVRDTATITVQGAQIDIAVAGTVDSLAILRGADRFIILPWQALPLTEERPLYPNGYLLAGSVDGAAQQDALFATAAASQLRWLSTIVEPPDGFTPASRLTTWSQRRAQLEGTGPNGVLTFAYGIGAAGGLVLALLAVGFAVLAGARTRGKVLSRLRTMGLTRRQGRRMLLTELGPVVTAAVLTGGAVGVALPQLIAPVLDLASFADGYDTGIRLDPLLLAGALGLVLAGLGTALLVENIFNRRQRLGEVLRLGGDG